MTQGEKMFSGIVSDLGKVTLKKKIQEGYKFRVKSKSIAKQLKKSGSVSINGVCHTIVNKVNDEFEFVSMHETLKKTNIGNLNVSDKVNLENSLKIGEEIGGHLVAGHIDDTGIITSVRQLKSDNTKDDSDNWEYWIKIDKKHFPFVIYVGSIAIDGVSLTVAELKPVKGNIFEIKVAIIPYTYQNTLFGTYKVGDKVNIEFDFLGKYVQKILESRPKLKRK